MPRIRYSQDIKQQAVKLVLEINNADPEFIDDRLMNVVPKDMNIKDQKVFVRLSTEVGCWAHACRKFHDSEIIFPEASLPFADG